MSELKPCPFCGSEARIERVRRHKLFPQFIFPYCTHLPYIKCNLCGATSRVMWTLEEAIEIWNRRTNP